MPPAGPALLRHRPALLAAGLAAALLTACGGGSEVAPDEVEMVLAEPELTEADAHAPVDYGWGPMQPTLPMREQMRILSESNLAAPAWKPDSGGAQAHVAGAFGPAVPWPVMPIHMVLLPDGRVLTYGSDEAGNQGATLHYALWDPNWQPAGEGGSPFEVLPNFTGTDIFCTTQLVLPQDGRVLMAGGDRTVGRLRNFATADVNVFDPQADALIKQPQAMNYRRWYGTAVTMSDGSQMVLGGRDDRDASATATRTATTATFSIVPEHYAPDTGWRALPGAASEAAFGANGSNWNYPEAWLAPNGQVFTIANTGQFYFIDPAGQGSITQTTGKLRSSGSLTPSVMYAPGRILSMRSGTRMQTVDINGGRPIIGEAAPASVHRRWGFTTVLADGTVWLNGGSSDGSNASLASAVYTSEIWSPKANAWTTAAVATKPRMYHGASLLLPNGAVLTGGGGAPGPAKQMNGEVYFPPYLFNPDGSFATRPQVAGVSSQSLGWRQPLDITLADDSRIERVTLVRFGTATHGLNNEQRHMDLAWTQDGRTVQVSTPAQAAVAPPGFYMLFVFARNTQFGDSEVRLVPSQAQVIRLSATP